MNELIHHRGPDDNGLYVSEHLDIQDYLVRVYNDKFVMVRFITIWK